MSEKTLVGYFESWSEMYASNPGQLSLANLAPYVNTVIVSFIKPDCNYRGNCNIDGTGLEFWANNNEKKDGTIFKDAIALLKQRNPNTKVLVSVGGASYKNFAQLNSTAIADIVKDFGFDGVDIDYEPDQAECSLVDGRISCTTDAEFRNIVNQIRQVLPRPYLVTLAAWSIGAYGEGQWVDAQPKGVTTGLMLNLLRSPESEMIDQLHIMSFNGGSTYNPQEALAAYQNYFKGKVVIGVKVPPEDWGGHVYTLAKVRALAQAVVENDAAGIMIWSLQSQPHKPSEDNPNAEMIAQTICKSFGFGNCQHPLFSIPN
ncbi:MULTISPECIES: glycosyl hydrolase family 18 protein [unclassified Microcoleus]|uniref:glycosyl hydrolase family 18 protein n=1 Tax=unclassified Microcoleus TaxID=2642155 RepID=UPI002FD610C6